MFSFLQSVTVGWFRTKPEFVTVLADKDTERGGNVHLSCEANIEDVTVTWEKEGKRLFLVQDKHIMRQTGKLFDLQIKNVQEEDEGKYTLTLSNISGTTSCSATLSLALKNWRKMPTKPDEMLQKLKQFQICDGESPNLHFLLNGPIGAGKSSIINTIKTIFENRQYINCLAATESGSSFTQKYNKYTVERLVFHDVMGLEESKGVHPKDIIKAFKGHIENGYKFRPQEDISDDDTYYIKNPGLHNHIYCLVSVLPADSISLFKEDVFKKMKTIRQEASELGIPQVVFLTKVDKACTRTRNDLRTIYNSRVIREKMEECSVKLTVPMNCIFPVKNYHEETQLNNAINCLMLDALTHTVNWATDFMKEVHHKQSPTRICNTMNTSSGFLDKSGQGMPKNKE